MVRLTATQSPARCPPNTVAPFGIVSGGITPADAISALVAEATSRYLPNHEPAPFEDWTKPWIRARAIRREDEPLNLSSASALGQTHDHRDQRRQHALAPAIHMGKFRSKDAALDSEREEDVGSPDSYDQRLAAHNFRFALEWVT